MRKIIKECKEGDILVKITENESDSIFASMSIAVIKILKKVEESSEDEESFIHIIRVFSNNQNPRIWEPVETISTSPSLHSISLIEYETNKDRGKKREKNSKSFIIKDDDDKIWDNAINHHYPPVRNGGWVKTEDLINFMNQIAGDHWKTCMGSGGIYSLFF